MQRWLGGLYFINWITVSFLCLCLTKLFSKHQIYGVYSQSDRLWIHNNEIFVVRNSEGERVVRL